MQKREGGRGKKGGKEKKRERGEDESRP